jgi:hypothetical protein
MQQVLEKFKTYGQQCAPDPDLAFDAHLLD